jgi:hypothetical protein
MLKLETKLFNPLSGSNLVAPPQYIFTILRPAVITDEACRKPVTGLMERQKPAFDILQ